MLFYAGELHGVPPDGEQEECGRAAGGGTGSQGAGPCTPAAPGAVPQRTQAPCSRDQQTGRVS